MQYVTFKVKVKVACSSSSNKIRKAQVSEILNWQVESWYEDTTLVSEIFRILGPFCCLLGEQRVCWLVVLVGRYCYLLYRLFVLYSIVHYFDFLPAYKQMRKFFCDSKNCFVKKIGNCFSASSSVIVGCAVHCSWLISIASSFDNKHINWQGVSMHDCCLGLWSVPPVRPVPYSIEIEGGNHWLFVVGLLDTFCIGFQYPGLNSLVWIVWNDRIRNKL